ncbi:MAG: phosphomannomutase [Deltaproteobacteria bacterium]|nr:phosphomannomutase [Deltaproteobacteria bacterium]MDZ4342227.1 phosphomannomutase [Candidatus Binatia bacterium]
MFLNYAPVPLAFGTSGLRGLVKDITDLEAYINVKAALRYLLSSGDIHASSTVVIAGDLRPSTDRIMRACAQAIVDSGCQVENAGKIPTPALVSRAISTRRAGVMVTGSHIPFDRNGIKINKSVGEVLKSDEPGISREVELVRAEEYSRTVTTSPFDASGVLKSAPELPALDRAAEETYVSRYLSSFNSGALSGLRVLVYQHSAVGRDILVRILRELGAEVVAAGRSETFIPIDTENVTDEQLNRLEEFAVAAEAGGKSLHAIVSTDGDSDRPLVTAVHPAAEVKPGGRRVRFLPGDLLGLVVAEYLSADAAAVPISANDAVERRMRERGVLLQKTKIGSPYVISGIDELRSAGTHARIVGWEANGGFLTGSDIALAKAKLAALPTRDSTLPILANLFAAASQGITLSALWDRLPARFGRAGLIDNFPAAVSLVILAKLIPAGDAIELEFDGAQQVSDRSRADATPTPLAAGPAEDWRQLKATLSRFFTPALGFDDIVRINVLDGVRIYFNNGDVAHIRPSGNAPQLRIYANSDSQARADQIVELGLREPDGILRQLGRAFTQGAVATL